MNSSEKSTAQSLTSSDESMITEYLRDHPDFLTRHPQLVTLLKIPHQTGDAASLVEYQVRILRKELSDTRQKLDQLIMAGYEKDRLNQRMHQFTLSLIKARSTEQMLTVLNDQLRTQFYADAVELKLFSSEEIAATPEDSPGLSVFQDFLEADHPTCGQLGREQLASLFGTEIGDSGSAAIIPINTPGASGVLAIGSTDRNRFSHDLGVDYLVRLGEVVSLALQALSNPG